MKYTKQEKIAISIFAAAVLFCIVGLTYLGVTV